jgi:hypothetical protein
MKQNYINLALISISWIIFTFIGRNSSIHLSQGFASFGDYLTFFFALVMFVIAWYLAFRYAHQLWEGHKSQAK